MITLSEETQFKIETPSWGGLWKGRWVLWRESAHAQSCRVGLVVLAGARVVFEPVLVTDSASGIITIGAGLPKISSDGLDLLVKFRLAEEKKISKGNPDEILLKYHIRGFDPDKPWTELEIPLDLIKGKYGSFVLECGPGDKNDPTADHLSVYEFVVSPRSSLKLNRARAFMERRMQNERKYFTQIYKHSMYNKKPAVNQKTDEIKKIPPSESVYSYTNELLNGRLDTKLPDFGGRLKDMVLALPELPDGKQRKLKILSLCSGAARIEENIIQQLPPGSVKLTISDVNAELLEVARQKLSGLCEVDLLKCDINSIKPADTSDEKFDVILCVSALHHIVELEKLMNFIYRSLVDEGEFWVIGEYVGRNGNRLWPEAYDIANGFFKNLPEKYRLNKTGSLFSRIDSKLPDNDCSINVFEGIRSEDIEECISRYFTSVMVHKYCCFLWRLFDLAYCDNYNLNSPGDIKIIENAVELELTHFHSGGKPTTLYGIYKKKTGDAIDFTDST